MQQAAEAEEEAMQLASGVGVKSRKSSAVWESFERSLTSSSHVRCIQSHPRDPGKKCHQLLKYSGGTTPLWSHLLWVHPDVHMALKRNSEEAVQEKSNQLMQSHISKAKAHWGPSKTARVRRRFALWIVK